jgi:replicative DNA helicase
VDYERLLLSRVAQTGQVNQLMAEGIREDHFSDDRLRKIYKFMTDHYRRYKIPPTFDTVYAEFPDFNFETSGENVSFLKDKFKKQVMYRFGADAVIRISEELADPDSEIDVDQLFMEESRRLATILPNASLHSFKDMDKRIQQYLDASEDSWIGIKSGVPAIDNLTYGIQPHEYVTVFGVTGAGKSTVSQWMLFNAWMQNKTPMYISLEMEANALFRKWDTMSMQFRYHDLKGHTLREEEIDRWKEKSREIAERPNDIIVMDDVRGCTVDRVYAEITRWKPDILCLDYINLMSARSSYSQNWEKIQYLTQELKQVSRTLKTPIIGIAQSNRSAFQQGATLENVGGSISIVQDSDLVFGLHSDEEMREEKKTELRLLKNRDGMVGNVDLWWEPETMTFGPWEETNYFRSRREELNV